MACPNDGEPLATNVNGIVFCPYDGWRPDGQVTGAGEISSA